MAPHRRGSCGVVGVRQRHHMSPAQDAFCDLSCLCFGPSGVTHKERKSGASGSFRLFWSGCYWPRIKPNSPSLVETFWLKKILSDGLSYRFPGFSRSWTRWCIMHHARAQPHSRRLAISLPGNLQQGVKDAASGGRSGTKAPPAQMGARAHG